MIRMQQFGHDVWALVQGYWRSEERWSAWALFDGDHRPRSWLCMVVHSK